MGRPQEEGGDSRAKGEPGAQGKGSVAAHGLWRSGLRDGGALAAGEQDGADDQGHGVADDGRAMATWKATHSTTPKAAKRKTATAKRKEGWFLCMAGSKKRQKINKRRIGSSRKGILRESVRIGSARAQYFFRLEG